MLGDVLQPYVTRLRGLWPFAIPFSVYLLDLTLRRLPVAPGSAVRIAFFFLVVGAFFGLVWAWIQQNFRSLAMESALVMVILWMALQIPDYMAPPYPWLLMGEAVLFLSLFLFRPFPHALLPWAYLLGYNLLLLGPETSDSRVYGLTAGWQTLWLVGIAVVQWRYQRLTRRVVETSAELTKLRLGSQWFASDITDTDSGGIARETDARAADAFVQFEAWWSRSMEPLARSLHLLSTALYQQSETGVWHRITFQDFGRVSPQWRERVEKVGPETRLVLNERRPFFGEPEIFRRHSVRWVVQPPLESGGYFLVPVSVRESDTALWLGILEEPLKPEQKEMVRWAGEQIEAMARLFRQAYQHQDRAQVLKRLHELTTQMAGALHVNDVISHFLQIVRFLVPFDGGILAITPLDQPDDVRYVWYEGFAPGARGRRLRLPRQPDRASWAAWIMQHRNEPMVIPLKTDAADLPVWSRKGPQPAWTTLAGLPLQVHQQTLGLFLVGRRDREFRADEIQWMAIVATEAALALRNAQLYERMSYHALRDGLTGVFNHRAFQEKLEQILKETGAPDSTYKEVSLLLLDIDHFKRINDTYGHPFGDEILKRVTGCIHKVVRHYDVVARYGGEEFAVILPGCDAQTAGFIAEEIRAEIESMRIQKGLDTLRVTASLGVATWPGDARDRKELIERADAALYHAKRNGRNQVWHWRDLPVERPAPEAPRPAPQAWWRRLLGRF